MMNVLHIMGRLTADPEITSTQSGTTIARYTVAVDRKFAKEGQQKTDFFSCTSFGIRHTPRYPSIGAMINAAINFPANSVKLAARGTIFLPIPCRLFLITRRILRMAL